MKLHILDSIKEDDDVGHWSVSKILELAQFPASSQNSEGRSKLDKISSSVSSSQGNQVIKVFFTKVNCSLRMRKTSVVHIITLSSNSVRLLKDCDVGVFSISQLHGHVETCGTCSNYTHFVIWTWSHDPWPWCPLGRLLLVQQCEIKMIVVSIPGPHKELVNNGKVWAENIQ